MMASFPQQHYYYCGGCRRSFSSTTLVDEKNDAKRRKKTLWLYRILLRQSNSLFLDNGREEEEEEWLLLQPTLPLDPRNYGQAKHFSAKKSTTTLQRNNKKSVFKILHWFRNHVQDERQQEENALRICQWWSSILQGFEKYYETNHDDFVGGKEDDDSLLDCLWVSQKSAVRRAIRHAFIHGKQEYQPLAIRAVRLLNEQESIMERTSISTNVEHGIRVVATSRCIGTASSGGAALADPLGTKHRFVYRIRVENISETATVQLLGRTWHIQEDKGDEPPVIVNAPTTGAVGHLPVLKPGQVFEYMSGCELATQGGFMRGCFHMATVPPETNSAMVGDVVDAFSQHPDTLFELEIKPFQLIVV